MTQLFMDWADALWMLAVFIALKRHQWLIGVSFIIGTMIAMRLQVELMAALGYPQGFFKLWDLPLHVRGLLIYSLFTLGYLILSFFSSQTSKMVYMAASITILISAFCVAMIAMVL